MSGFRGKADMAYCGAKICFPKRRLGPLLCSNTPYENCQRELQWHHLRKIRGNFEQAEKTILLQL